MLDKGNIIKSAFLRLGNTEAYNDNGLDEWKIATELLEDVIRKFANNKRFLYNAKTIQLTALETEVNFNEEYTYNLPIDFVNLISCEYGRIEGYLVYSTYNTLVMQYCAKINFTRIPDYMEDIIIDSLCLALCLSYSQYAKKAQGFANIIAINTGEIEGNETDNTRNYRSQISDSQVGG